MSKRIPASKKDISFLTLHFVVYAIAVVIMWTTYTIGSHGHWVYPWPAWITAAWGLLLIGHICITFTSYEDPGMKKYREEQGKAYRGA
jgi:2TM domain